jgi:hypothetical protein
LQQARAHERPRSLADIDKALLFPAVEVPDQFLYEHEHLVLGLSFALAEAARNERAVQDVDLIAALDSLARTYETLANSGLHYQSPTTNLCHQAIAGEVQAMIKQYREAEEKHLGYSRLRDSDVLRALVFLLRMGYARTSGRPKSRAYVDFVVSQFPESPPTGAAPDQAASRLIVP